MKFQLDFIQSILEAGNSRRLVFIKQLAVKNETLTLAQFLYQLFHYAATGARQVDFVITAAPASRVRHQNRIEPFFSRRDIDPKLFSLFANYQRPPRTVYFHFRFQCGRYAA